MKVKKKEQLGTTKRGHSGFGSTGVTVIKKMKPNKDESEGKSDPEPKDGSEPETHTEIVSEEAVFSVNNKVIVKEKNKSK